MLKYRKVPPPFGYFGSKNKIALRLCENLPPHNCWIEAFCGSASVTLSKPPAPIEIINDIDGEIVNLFNQLRENSKALIETISLTPYARQELILARSNSQTKISEIERARIFLVKAMMAMNGAFGEKEGGFSISPSYTRNNKEARVNRWYNLPAKLELVVERLRSVRVENQNAINLLEDYIDRPATLIYLDPPYFVERTKGYENEAFDEKFHTHLLRLVNKAKCMIFISGYESPLYNDMLSDKKGWVQKKIITSTKGSSGTSHARTEIVWMNSIFVDAQINNTLPLRLKRKEIKMDKVNPKR